MINLLPPQVPTGQNILVTALFLCSMEIFSSTMSLMTKSLKSELLTLGT